MKLLSKLEFWWIQRKYAEGKYFRPWPLQPPGITQQAWEILKGPYKGFVFYFDKLTFTENNAVNFSVIFHYASIDATWYKYQAFVKIARKILLVIINRVITNDLNLRLGLKPGQEFNDEDRTNYSEEPDPKRTIHKKSPSLSEE